jgi:hypothetical protein
MASSRFSRQGIVQDLRLLLVEFPWDSSHADSLMGLILLVVVFLMGRSS